MRKLRNQDKRLSGNDVLRERLSIGLNREELAARAGLSMKTIERIERGESIPRRATLHVIEEALGLRSPTVKC